MDKNEAASTHTQHGFEAAGKVAAFWQEFLTAQLGQLDASLARLDTFAKDHAARAETQLAEANKLIASTFNWMGELQSKALATARELVQKAGEPLKAAHG
jgi:hypothetical protein